VFVTCFALGKDHWGGYGSKKRLAGPQKKDCNCLRKRSGQVDRKSASLESSPWWSLKQNKPEQGTERSGTRENWAKGKEVLSAGNRSSRDKKEKAFKKASSPDSDGPGIKIVGGEDTGRSGDFPEMAHENERRDGGPLILLALSLTV